MENRRAPLPTPLVTGGSLTAPLPGALGQPGTSVQIGGTSVSLPIEAVGRSDISGGVALRF